MKNIINAILKTIAYSDLFDYPLLRDEIYQNLLEEKVEYSVFVKILRKCVDEKILEKESDYYFLPGRSPIVEKRKRCAIISRTKYEKALPSIKWLKFNPWLQMVAITGALSVDNANQGDDVDLMFVFSKNRLFLGRLVEFVILKLLGKRRKPKQQEVADLLCPNLYLSEDNLLIKDQNLYTAHEITQVRLVWERKPLYKKFIEENKWVKKYLPQWEMKEVKGINTGTDKKLQPLIIFDWLELLAKKIQLSYMKRKVSIEKISDDALFFHPRDTKSEILKAYDQKVSQIGLK